MVNKTLSDMMVANSEDMMGEVKNQQLIETGPATAILPAGERVSPITVIGTEAIRATFDDGCLRQAINSRRAPGVTQVVLNPDAHVGYGAPIGCVLVSPSHIYPGPVGVDIKVHPAEAYVDLKKCGHVGPIWSCTNDFRKEYPACPQACCTMDLGFVTTAT